MDFIYNDSSVKLVTYEEGHESPRLLGPIFEKCKVQGQLNICFVGLN